MPKTNVTHKPLFIATAVAMVVYILWRTFFTLPLEYELASLAVGILLLACEAVAALEALEQYLNMAYAEHPELPDIPSHWYPEVDIFIITHNEDVELLFKTVNAATWLAYPDKSKLHVYLCDDANRPEMRELARRLGVGYFGMAENKHAKAGNFNNALFQTSSPLVATFDADMIPHRNFLMRAVPYFFLPRLKKDSAGRWAPRAEEEIDRNRSIGFVQTPQSFYNPDLFQFNLHAETRQPNEQDYFFREINVGRNRTNSPIFAGSNSILSRQALMAVGGMATNSITEDFETGMRIQGKGYGTYAVNETLSHGLAPHTIKSLMAQRERWGRGCVQSLRNVRPFFSPQFSLKAKVSLLTTLVYWWTFFRRFVYTIAPILSVVFGMHIVVCELWQILLFWLPYYFLNNRTLTILSGGTRTQHWSNLIDTIMFPYLVGPMIMETLGFQKKKFVVTKKKKEEAPSTGTMALPHIFLLAASAAALFICLRQSLEHRTVYNAIIIFWLIVNGKNLALAVFFMMGRHNYRQSDRFKAELPVEIEYRGHTYTGLTTDISEDGLAVTLAFPAYLPDEESCLLRIDGDMYQAEMKCTVVYVAPPRRGCGWRYSFKIVDLDDANRRQYSQIVYDRPHSLPVIIAETVTVLDDFRVNLENRLRSERQIPAIRRLPRLTLKLSTTDAEGRPVTIDDFNYRYVWLRSGSELPVETEVEAAPGVRFILRMVTEQVRPDKNGALYLVLNWEELLDAPDFNQVLSRWVQAQNGDPSPPDDAVVKPGSATAKKVEA